MSGDSLDSLPERSYFIGVQHPEFTKSCAYRYLEFQLIISFMVPKLNTFNRNAKSGQVLTVSDLSIG
jgi:hypothetical protein